MFPSSSSRAERLEDVEPGVVDAESDALLRELVDVPEEDDLLEDATGLGADTDFRFIFFWVGNGVAPGAMGGT